jgi:hypothetical protein
MAITYTWEITEMQTVDSDSLDDVVMQTKWIKTGTDETGATGKFAGATPFNPKSVSPDAFTPYDQLTETIVLGWIQAVVVGKYAEHVNKKIADEIAAKTIKKPALPWTA